MAIRTLILPGLDGGADLRSEFVAALAPEFDASVLAYPVEALDYDGLTEWVAARLPRDEPYVLVAESFSGPIAIRLAAMRPPELLGVVLVASFARCPRPRWPALARLLPLQRLPLASFFLLGRWSTPEWKQRLRAALASVPRLVLRRRFLTVGEVDVAARVPEMACPILYLRASHDRIVPRKGWTEIRDASLNAVCIELEGPHMLLQARPRECAEAMKR